MTICLKFCQASLPVEDKCLYKEEFRHWQIIPSLAKVVETLFGPARHYDTPYCIVKKEYLLSPKAAGLCKQAIETQNTQPPWKAYQEKSKTMFDEIFDQLAIFEGMDTSQRALLKTYFVMCECKEDEVIFVQGDRAEFLYVVIKGEVAIHFKPDDGPELAVSHIKEGGVFGWSAAFGSGFYTSGATCTQSAKMLRVLGTDLKMLRENHPKTGILVLERLAAVVAKRMEKNGDHSQVVAFLEHGLKNGIKPIGG